MCSRWLSPCSGGAAGAEVSTPEIPRVSSHRTDCRACRAEASHHVANLAIAGVTRSLPRVSPGHAVPGAEPEADAGTRRRRGTLGRFRAASVLTMLLVTACTPKHHESRRAEMAGAAGRMCQLSDTWRRGVSAFLILDLPPTRAVTARTSRPPSSSWLALQRAHCFPACLSIPPLPHSLLLNTLPTKQPPHGLPRSSRQGQEIHSSHSGWRVVQFARSTSFYVPRRHQQSFADTARGATCCSGLHL